MEYLIRLFVCTSSYNSMVVLSDELAICEIDEAKGKAIGRVTYHRSFSLECY